MDLKYKIILGTLLLIATLRFSCMSYGIPGIYTISEQGQIELYNSNQNNGHPNPRINKKTLQDCLDSE